MTQQQPQAPPTRDQMWAHLQALAQAGDLDTARLAVENGQIQLTAEEQAELEKLAAEAEEKKRPARKLTISPMGRIGDSAWHPAGAMTPTRAAITNGTAAVG